MILMHKMAVFVIYYRAYNVFIICRKLSVQGYEISAVIAIPPLRFQKLDIELRKRFAILFKGRIAFFKKPWKDDFRNVKKKHFIDGFPVFIDIASVNVKLNCTLTY